MTDFGSSQRCSPYFTLRFVVVILLLGISFFQTRAQQYFEDITNSSNILHSYDGEYGSGASFADFNGDGWDDLTVCDNDGILFFKNVNGQFFPIAPPVELESAYKQVTWVDFDNDGDKDLFCSGEYVPFRLFKNIGDFTFQEITTAAGLPDESNVRTNGHCWGDYNKDGFLDLFVCNYEQQTYSNWIFKNNGDGTFTDQTVELGFSDTKEFSFQSVFFDYNDDGWQDLLIINDKIVHPNRLYKNENGSFEDVTQTAGLYFIVNSMSNSVADFNNDGLQDVFISDANNNLLHRNNGDGTFEEISQSAGLSDIGFTWGGLFIDVDNNSMLDIVICSSTELPGSGKNFLFMNEGDETYSENTTSGLGNQLTDSYCPVKGDFNNDGHGDVFITGGNAAHSLLMENTGSGGNYIKLKLEGLLSNRDGIGSKVELWSNSTMQTKYTQCGEGYLGQNSNTMIFGLGDEILVDSIKITWLSGVVDEINNVPANQTIELLEGETLTNQIQLIGESSLCVGDSAILFAGNFASYLWSTGDTTSSITVDNSGQFSVTVTNNFGFQIVSDTIDISVHPNPIIAPSVQHIDCYGHQNGSISLTNLAGSPIDSCIWNNTINGVAIDPLTPGEYSYELVDTYGCTANGVISISQPDPIKVYADIANQVGDQPGSAEVFLTGGTPPYSLFWSNGQENTTMQDSLTSGFYGIWIVDDNGCKAYALLYIDFIQAVESEALRNLRVFPNPVTDKLNIEQLPPGTSEISIHGIDGKLMDRKRLNSNEASITLDIRTLPSGLYFLSIHSPLGIINKQVIKK